MQYCRFFKNCLIINSKHPSLCRGEIKKYMKEKPFYKLPLVFVRVKRSKYNPMRFILGDYYLSSDPMKLDLDVKDIKFIKFNEKK